MSLEEDIAFLQQVPTLGVLGEAALRILAIGAETRGIGEGEALFEAGDSADSAYVIQEGGVTLEPADPRMRSFRVGPGTLLGELALLTEVKRPATAVADGPGVVIRIPRTLFRKILESYPDAAVRLRDLMASRAVDTAREFSRIGAALDVGMPHD